MKKLIEVRNLVKTFNNKKIQALKGINLDIYDNQNIALIGSNGAGKTTFVEILVGLNKYDSGSIKYYINKKDIGIQFQDSIYPQGVSVKNVVEFMINAYNIKFKDNELDKILTMFGIKSFYKRRAKSLSGGQQQRLNVLLSLLHKPKILILDELSTGLDINIRTQIRNFIKEYAKKNKMNIILISHDMNDIINLVDKVYIIKKGVISKTIDLRKDKKININNLEEMIKKYI